MGYFQWNGSYKKFKKYVGFNNEKLVFEKLPSTSSTPGLYVKTFDEKVEIWSVIRTYLEN
jgi:hypothetical protein